MTGILRDTETGNLMIRNGSLQLGNITEDVAEVVMMSAAGELKHAPLIGANLVRAVNGSTDPFLPAKVKKMLIAEMVPVRVVRIINNDVTLEL